MWPVFVVVAAIDAKHMLEVAAAEDEDPVEAVGAKPAYPASARRRRSRSAPRPASGSP